MTIFNKNKYHITTTLNIHFKTGLSVKGGGGIVWGINCKKKLNCGGEGLRFRRKALFLCIVKVVRCCSRCNYCW